jgi:hypothetical protein
MEINSRFEYFSLSSFIAYFSFVCDTLTMSSYLLYFVFGGYSLYSKWDFRIVVLSYNLE